MATVDSGVEQPGQVRRAERPVTVKIAASEVDLLQALALLAETTMAQQIRSAVEQYLEWRLTRSDLDETVAAAKERQSSLLGQLLDPDSPRALEVKPQPAWPTRPTPQKSITLRIPNRECDLMTALALLDETTLAAQLRNAVERYLEKSLSDQTVGPQVQDVQQERERVLSATA